MADAVIEAQLLTIARVFGISIGLLCIFLSHILVIRLTVHFEMQESLGFILLPQVFQLLGPAGGSLILLSYGLVLEKALRFFPHLEYDLQIRVDDQRQQ